MGCWRMPVFQEFSVEVPSRFALQFLTYDWEQVKAGHCQENSRLTGGIYWSVVWLGIRLFLAADGWCQRERELPSTSRRVGPQT